MGIPTKWQAHHSTARPASEVPAQDPCLSRAIRLALLLVWMAKAQPCHATCGGAAGHSLTHFSPLSIVLYSDSGMRVSRS